MRDQDISILMRMAWLCCPSKLALMILDALIIISMISEHIGSNKNGPCISKVKLINNK
jgi:hypothetical protein